MGSLNCAEPHRDFSDTRRIGTNLGRIEDASKVILVIFSALKSYKLVCWSRGVGREGGPGQGDLLYVRASYMEGRRCKEEA